MIIFFTASLLVFSVGSFAEESKSFCPVDSMGKPAPPFGYKITGVKNSPSKDFYEIYPSEDNPYGGGKILWVAFKDSQGRIIKIESGGEKPSPKVVKFEVQKRALALKMQIDSSSESKAFSIVGASQARAALAGPEDYPIKIGSSVEMDYQGTQCKVTKFAERFYDLKTSNPSDKVVFDYRKCDQLRDLSSRFEKETASCAEKTERHEQELAGLLNSSDRPVGLTSGAGGGGGAPVRGIASAEENVDHWKSNLNRSIADSESSDNSVISMNNYLIAGASGFRTKLLREKEYCNILSPSSAIEHKTLPGSGSNSSKQ
jgi:hypothetical protein